MSAEGTRQAVAAAEKVDGAGLAVVLSEDPAGFVFVLALLGCQAVPRNGGFGDDLFPAKLIGVPLRQRGAGVAVLHDGKLEGKSFRVGEEGVRRKNRHSYRSKMCATGQQNDYDRVFHPRATGRSIFRGV